MRKVAIEICESAGMAKLGNTVAAGWGWREDVANI